MAVAHKHHRLQVGDDRFRLQCGNVVINPPELVVQSSETVTDEPELRDSQTGVLDVHRQKEYVQHAIVVGQVDRVNTVV